MGRPVVQLLFSSTSAHLNELKDSAGRPDDTRILPGCRLLRLSAGVLAKDCFATEIADQVNTCSKGDNVLEKEEA